MAHAIRRRYRRALTAACAALLLALGACADPVSLSGATPQGGPPPVVRIMPKVAAEVPKALRDKGYLVFATNGPNVPLVSFAADNSTLTGYDIELVDAIGKAMGLRIRWQNIAFDSILPGMQAGRYDAGISSFSIEADRLEQVDFVSYVLTGGGFLIRRGSGIRVGSFDDLCGYRAAVQKGASQISSLTAAGERCARRGREPVEILQIPDKNALTLTLQSHRSDVVVGDKAELRYIAARSGGATCVVSTYQTDHSLAGIAVPKGHPQLLVALRDAINGLIRSGAYARIGARWDVGTAEPGFRLSADYARKVAPLGVGPDATVTTSRIFTDPRAISDGEHKYRQPIVEGCA